MNRTIPFRSLLAGLALVALGTSCTTTYDAYGRPRQSVDPGLAIAGVAAAGLIGYAIGNNNDDHGPRHYRRSHRRGYDYYGHDRFHNHSHRSHRSHRYYRY